MVSAAWPPVRCGVGDYTSQLAAALEAAGARVVRFGAVKRRWDTAATGEAARRLRALGADVVHVQYPSTGYGRSLLPSLLPMLLRDVKVVVTLHEFSIFRAYRWPWFAPFAYAADACVFTSVAEQLHFRARLPNMRAQSWVIPIGSNIPRGRAATRNMRAVCYFGLLMPHKGVEAFFELAEQAAGGGWAMHLIGAVPPGCEDYAAAVISRAHDLGVAQHIGLGADAVADCLQGMGYAYLPGPGGITERRGAVLAALENGVRVIGPLGSSAPDWLREQVVQAGQPQDVLRLLGGQKAAMQPTAPAAATRWDSIAARHMALYESLPARVSL